MRLLICIIISLSIFTACDHRHSNKWTPEDSKLVAIDMSKKILEGDWLIKHLQNTQKKPMLQIDYISIQTNGQVIDSTICTDKMVEILLNSNRTRVSSDKDVSRKVREHLRDQDNYASLETKKKMFREIGADYFLTGSIRLHDDRDTGKRTYSVNMKLLNIENNEIVWIGNYDLLK